VFPGQSGEKSFREKRESFEFMAADGERKDGDVDGAGAETFEKNRSDFLNDSEANLGKFARERSEMRREEIGGDRGNHTDADGTSERIFLLDDVAARSFEFAEDGTGTGKKRLADVGEADGAAEAVEKAGAEFVFELEDLLGERRLRDVRLLGGAAEGAGFGDGAEVAKLVKFHKRVKSSNPKAEKRV
jgi:hypothetical protein